MNGQIALLIRQLTYKTIRDQVITMQNRALVIAAERDALLTKPDSTIELNAGCLTHGQQFFFFSRQRNNKERHDDYHHRQPTT